MAQDLRSYLDLLKRKRPDDWMVVSQEIDPVHEITALVVKLERELKRRPAAPGSPSSPIFTRAARAWPWPWAPRPMRCSARTCAPWSGRSRRAW
jgi:hypothetical protein